MATQPDPAPVNAQPDPAPAPRNGPKRPGLQRIWTATDGGPGPASWRKHEGKARGLVRRKGDKNPLNHRLHIDPVVLADDKHKDWRPLADLDSVLKKEPSQKKPKNRGKKGLGLGAFLLGGKGKKQAAGGSAGGSGSGSVNGDSPSGGNKCAPAVM